MCTLCATSLRGLLVLLALCAALGSGRTEQPAGLCSGGPDGGVWYLLETHPQRGSWLSHLQVRELLQSFPLALGLAQLTEAWNGMLPRTLLPPSLLGTSKDHTHFQTCWPQMLTLCPVPCPLVLPEAMNVESSVAKDGYWGAGGKERGDTGDGGHRRWGTSECFTM